MIAATRALTSADRHIEHGSALVATWRPSSVGRPERGGAATRISVISACAVGSLRVTCVLLAFARSSSGRVGEHGPERRVAAASTAFAACVHRQPDEALRGGAHRSWRAHAGSVRSSISQAWSSACHAIRRAA